MASDVTLYREKPTGIRGAADTALRAVIRNTAGARLRARKEEADKLEKVAELVGIRASDPRPLDVEDFKRQGAEDNVHGAVIHALAYVEGGTSGFYEGRIQRADGSAIADPGKGVALVEPHIFSALTFHAWDKLRPDLSYPNWTPNRKGAPAPGGFQVHPYTYSYDDRWGLVAAMAEVDPDAAIGAISLGRFQQVIGSPRETMGWKLLRMGSPENLFRTLMQSERTQLEIMRLFFKANGGMAALRNAGKGKTAADRLPNWRTLARIYNGPGQVEKYSAALEKEFQRVLRYYG